MLFTGQMVVGGRPEYGCFCLRYGRAPGETQGTVTARSDGGAESSLSGSVSRATVSLEPLTARGRFPNRSVGEPAEGSLTS